MDGMTKMVMMIWNDETSDKVGELLIWIWCPFTATQYMSSSCTQSALGQTIINFLNFHNSIFSISISTLHLVKQCIQVLELGKVSGSRCSMGRDHSIIYQNVTNKLGSSVACTCQLLTLPCTITGQAGSLQYQCNLCHKNHSSSVSDETETEASVKCFFDLCQHLGATSWLGKSNRNVHFVLDLLPLVQE